MSRDLTAADVKRLVGTESPFILEIGCNDGTDTLRFLDEMPGATIHCFEPDPRPIERFKSNLDGDQRVHLHEVAVCDKDGEAVFHGSSGQVPNPSPSAAHYWHLPECDLSGSLYRPTGHLKATPWMSWPEERQFMTRTIRLDSWLQFYDPPAIDFIWADVQGAEHTLIQGATEALARTRYFYTEFYDRPMYQGQQPLAKLRNLLPRFTLEGTHGHNALFLRQQ